jgi:hypothetical protein
VALVEYGITEVGYFLRTVTSRSKQLPPQCGLYSEQREWTESRENGPWTRNIPLSSALHRTDPENRVIKKIYTLLFTNSGT